MIINSATSIYFSPTGTTKKVINAIVKGMGMINNNSIDLTCSNIRNKLMPAINEDIVLIGVPVYATGVPNILKPFLTNLKGNNKPVVLIAVYGNMSEGTALNELYTITENSGFKIVGAGSFIGEHSFSTEETPIAKGRPNYEDLNKAEEFGRKIIEKMRNMNDLSTLQIPMGKKPLMAKILPEDSARIFNETPTPDINLCSRCNTCVKLCPMGAIHKDTLEVNENKCIRCFCCVRKCPIKARKIVYKPKFLVSKVLAIKNRKARMPQIYI